MIKIKKINSGFALLIAMIVVGVVVSVGLSILELTIKQLALSTGSKDSETALHAANAGIECAQYWRNKEYKKFEDGDSSIDDISCFGDSGKSFTKSNTKPSPGNVTKNRGDAYVYSIQLATADRCSKITMLILESDNESVGGVTVNNVGDILPGYASTATKTCEPGGRCTYTSVQGYNKSCSNIGAFGTIQREVLLES
jgi:hypothetical protein